jgi:Plasmid encoded RepA protein
MTVAANPGALFLAESPLRGMEAEDEPTSPALSVCGSRRPISRRANADRLDLARSGDNSAELKKLDAIVQAREPDAPRQRAFSARPFVLCGIPIRRPVKHILEYSRRNGKFRLRVIGHPDFGLPFGQDRLLLIWIASMATWHKTRVIRFRSAATILDAFHLPKDGRYYRRLIAGFERIFYSTFYFASDEQAAEAVVVTRTSFRFVRDLRLWYFNTNDARTACDDGPRENLLVLSDEFWREIQEHPVPVDLNIVRALADSPGNLDLYVWLRWRSWTSKGRTDIHLFGSHGLICQLGNSDNLRERDFRRQIIEWLKVLRQFWPDCPAEVGPSGTTLVIYGKRPRIPTTTPAAHLLFHATQFAVHT